MTETPVEVKARSGNVPESGAVFEKFSAVEYLTLVARLHLLPEDVIAQRFEIWLAIWLAHFGLTGERATPMSGLSKGTRHEVCWIPGGSKPTGLSPA